MSIYNDQEFPVDTVDTATHDEQEVDDREAKARIKEAIGDKLTEKAKKGKNAYDITI